MLALIERLELLVSIFSKGERPTGSSDPYALRRAGNGILQILWNKNWELNLFELIRLSTIYWSDLLPELNVCHDTITRPLMIYATRPQILQLYN